MNHPPAKILMNFGGFYIIIGHRDKFFGKCRGRQDGGTE